MLAISSREMVPECLFCDGNTVEKKTDPQILPLWGSPQETWSEESILKMC